jgi:hypothetical protein
MFISPLKQLKTENLELLGQLSHDDQKLILSIIKRMNIFKVNSIQAQIIQRDLIGMAIEHQNRGSLLTEEFGENPEVFANEVYDSAGSFNWQEVLLNLTIRMSGYFFLWFLFSALMLYGGFTWQSNWSIYPFYAAVIIISFVIELLITPHFIMKQGIKQHFPQFIGLALIISTTAGFIKMSSSLTPHVINVLPIIATSGAIFVIAQFVQNQLFLKIASKEKNPLG